MTARSGSDGSNDISGGTTNLTYVLGFNDEEAFRNSCRKVETGGEGQRSLAVVTTGPRFSASHQRVVHRLRLQHGLLLQLWDDRAPVVSNAESERPALIPLQFPDPPADLDHSPAIRPLEGSHGVRGVAFLVLPRLGCCLWPSSSLSYHCAISGASGRVRHHLPTGAPVLLLRTDPQPLHVHPVDVPGTADLLGV